MNRVLAAFFLCLMAMGTAEARTHGGTSVSAPPAAVLANATNTFGNRTIAGYGEERLSRMDQNYGARYSPYGTGILVSGSCAKWSTAVLSGNASYWNTLSHVVEGTTAVTPNLTVTGVTNQAGGAGTSTSFTITCEDASNNPIATSTLTYNIVGGDNSCGAVSIGDQDNTGVNYFPSGFASTVDGCKVLMSTGYVKTGRFVLGMPFSHLTTLTFADPARPGELQNIETGSNSTHAAMQDIMVVGATTNCSGCNAAFVLGGTGTTGDNLHAYATSAMRTAGSHQCIQTFGNNTVTHFGCEWYGGFFTVSSGSTYQYGWSRFASADAITTGNGAPNGFTVKDITVMSMKQPVSNHPDVFQLSDGSTPYNYTVQRIMAISAGGDVLFQGPFFGGGVSGIPTISAPDPWMGYVDDGTGTHGPGNILTVTSNGGMQSNATGSRIYSLAGSPVGLADGVTSACGGTPCPFGIGKQYTLTGFSGNYGSVGTPVQFYGLPNGTATWDQIWNSGDVIQGMFYSGNTGTSTVTHFTHMRETTPGVTGTGSPFLKFQNCAYPIYNGSLSVSKGAEYSTWASDCSPTTNPPPNTTVTNVLSASSNTTTLASWYVNGDPKPCLESQSIAQWDAMTVQQAMVYAASCTIVKTGGPLDLGAGDVANAMGTALTPTWADGTVVGTGFTGQ